MSTGEPEMINASPELVALLNSSDQFIMADLYTITTQSGQVLRYTSADVDVFQEGTTNLLVNPTFGTVAAPSLTGWSVIDWSTGPANQASATTAVGPFNEIIPVCQLTRVSGSTSYNMICQVPPGLGSNMSTQVWVKPTADTAIFLYNGVAWFNAGVAPAGVWTQIQRPNHATGTASNPQFRIAPNLAVGSSCLLAFPQLEQLDHCTPFTTGTRAALGPFDSSLPLTRDTTRVVTGLEVDTLTVTFYPTSANLIGSVPFLQAVSRGVLDGADFTLERAFITPDWQSLAGTIIRFQGRISDIPEYGRTAIPVTVKSDLEILNVKMPRNIYQPNCRRTLYDLGCSVNRAAYAVSGTAQSGSTASMVVCGIAQAAGYFDLGTIEFTSGQNAGVTRTVKSYTSGVFNVVPPLPYAPASGDGFTCYPGCDKLQTTCSAKFNNLINFSGEPFIPAAETAY